MSVKIVPMTADHLEELEKLERICFSRPWSRKMLAEELENQCAAFLVAEDSVSGRVLGYAGLMVVADEGYITNVAVFPEYRRQGVAAALLERAIDDARTQGRKGLVLTCKDKLVHYYAKFGFVSEGVSVSTHGGVVWYQMRLTF